MKKIFVVLFVVLAVYGVAQTAQSYTPDTKTKSVKVPKGASSKDSDEEPTKVISPRPSTPAFPWAGETLPVYYPDYWNGSQCEQRDSFEACIHQAMQATGVYPGETLSQQDTDSLEPGQKYLVVSGQENELTTDGLAGLGNIIPRSWLNIGQAKVFVKETLTFEVWERLDGSHKRMLWGKTVKAVASSIECASFGAWAANFRQIELGFRSDPRTWTYYAAQDKGFAAMVKAITGTTSRKGRRT